MWDWQDRSVLSIDTMKCLQSAIRQRKPSKPTPTCSGWESAAVEKERLHFGALLRFECVITSVHLAQHIYFEILWLLRVCVSFFMTELIFVFCYHWNFLLSFFYFYCFCIFFCSVSVSEIYKDIFITINVIIITIFYCHSVLIKDTAASITVPSPLHVYPLLGIHHWQMFS